MNLKWVADLDTETDRGIRFPNGVFIKEAQKVISDPDIDIVIEGEGIAFARQFARLYGARLHTHAKFGTAVIIFADGFKIDVATARMEYYKFPAALPTVADLAAEASGTDWPGVIEIGRAHV